MNLLRCEHCASTDLTRLSPGEYRCNHCKAALHVESEEAAPATPARKLAPAPQTTPSTARKVLSIVLLIGLVAGLAALRIKGRERRREQLRQTMLQRDIAAKLNARFRSGATTGTTGFGGSASTPLPVAKPAVEYGGAAVETPKLARAEFIDAVPLPDRIGNLYVVGLYKNTGEAVLDHPRVEATLWDKDHHKLAVGNGYASLMNLLPGEETPLKILIQRAPAYDSITYHVAPAPLRYGSPQRFTLVIDSPKLELAQFGGYRLVGTIQNKDKVDVRHVRIVALLLSAQKKIIAMQEGFAPQQVLPAGDASPFAISVHQVNGTPKSFRLYTSAMAAQ